MQRRLVWSWLDCAGAILLRAGDQTDPLDPQQVPPEQVPWERLRPAVPQAACRRSGEGAGISSLELAACARRGRRKQAPADREAGMRQ